MFSCTTAQHIYCTNCTVCNWAVLTVIKQKLLLNVQLHNRTFQLMSSEVECSRLLDITSTYADFRSFKKFTWLNVLPQFHNVKQQPNLLCYHATAWPLTSQFIRPMGWRNSGMCCDPAWLAEAGGARSQRIILPSIRIQHSHWAIPATVTQAYSACSATSHCFQDAIQLVPVSGWCDVGLFTFGVSLIALGLRTVTAVVMVFIPQNVTKISNCHTVQTEGKLKCCQCPVQIWVNACQFHGLSL